MHRNPQITTPPQQKNQQEKQARTSSRQSTHGSHIFRTSPFCIDNTLSPPLSDLHGQENFTISGIWLTQIVDKATSPNNECILIRVCQPYIISDIKYFADNSPYKEENLLIKMNNEMLHLSHGRYYISQKQSVLFLNQHAHYLSSQHSPPYDTASFHPFFV